MELRQEKDYSVRWTQVESTSKLAPAETSPGLRAARQRLPPPEDVLRRQCTLGELRWLVTALRPDICARLARLAPEVKPLKGRDTYRDSDSIKTIQVWRPARVLDYTSSRHPNEPARGDEDGRMRARGGGTHRWTTSLVGWSDAAYGDLPKTSRCRLVYIIGLTSLPLPGPRHMLQWTSMFTRSLGGEV